MKLCIKDIGECNHYFGPKLIECTGSIYRSLAYIAGDAGKLYSIY